MNNISDKNVIIILLVTIFFIFGLIFSVKSPERKVIESPLIWKDNYTQSYKTSESSNQTFINTILIAYIKNFYLNQFYSKYH